MITGYTRPRSAIDLQMIQSMGGTPVWPLIALSNIAQGSAVIGIIISSRKHNEREISVPAAISAWLGVSTCNVRHQPEISLPDAVRDDWFWSGRIAMRPERRYGEWHRRRRPTGNSLIQPSYWQVFALAMAIAIIIPIVLTSFIYQRKYRLGTLDIV